MPWEEQGTLICPILPISLPRTMGTLQGREGMRDHPSLPPWHGVGSMGELLSVALGGTGSLRDPTFPDQFSWLSTHKLSQCLSSVPKSHCEALQKLLRYFSKRQASAETKFLSLGKLMGSPTLSTTKALVQTGVCLSAPSHPTWEQ